MHGLPSPNPVCFPPPLGNPFDFRFSRTHSVDSFLSCILTHLPSSSSITIDDPPNPIPLICSHVPFLTIAMLVSLSITATTLSAALLLFTTATAALPHLQPHSVEGLEPRKVKYDQFDDFYADWLREQDRRLGGGKPGDKVKRGQVQLKKHEDIYAGLLDARLRRLGRTS